MILIVVEEKDWNFRFDFLQRMLEKDWIFIGFDCFFMEIVRRTVERFDGFDFLQGILVKDCFFIGFDYFLWRIVWRMMEFFDGLGKRLGFGCFYEKMFGEWLNPLTVLISYKESWEKIGILLVLTSFLKICLETDWTLWWFWFPTKNLRKDCIFIGFGDEVPGNRLCTL